ncbi:MAG: hypothetical protein JSW71_02465 [Gemmatimonadota bacterium]|nr:MAG: hypothetical protein JSW71_02465 [Gemmatimonadota bacterium]
MLLLGMVLPIVSPTGARLNAQSGVGLALSLAPMPVAVTRTADTTASRFSGLTIGGSVGLRLGRLRLDLRYLEGGLGSDLEIPDQDIVEGELLLGVAPLAWLTVKAGPHIRSFVTAQGTQRWVFWEGRVAATAKLGSPNLLTYLEAWHVFFSDVDAVEQYDSGNGLEGGIRLALDRLPFWGTLAYRIDQNSLGSGTKTDTVEQLVIAIGWFVRR